MFLEIDEMQLNWTSFKKKDVFQKKDVFLNDVHFLKRRFFSSKWYQKTSFESSRRNHIYSYVFRTTLTIADVFLKVSHSHKSPPKAVILFDEQRTAISLKRAVPLFVAQIVILFIRIVEQIAETALFLFSIRFERSRIDEQRGLFVPHETNRRIEEQRFPPFLHHSAHFKNFKFILLCSKSYHKCESYTVPLFTKIRFQ
jgi:hypothetical protein